MEVRGFLSSPLSNKQFYRKIPGPENPPAEVSVDINEANIAVLRFKFDHQVGLKPKTFYRVRVSAKNDVAEGPVSETKEFETAHSELPIPTDIRTSVAEDNTLTITFSAVRDPDDHSNAIGRYKIEMAQSNDILSAKWHPVNASNTSIDEMTSQVTMTIDGTRLARSSMYWVKITASLDNPTRFVQASKPRWFRTGDGKGPVSETKEFETAHSELPIPTDIRTSVAEDNTLTITFSAVRDPDDHSNAIGRYKIEMAQSDDILSAKWHPVNASNTSIDEMTSQVTMTIDGTRLARSSMYWVKITASLDNPTRFVQASKPRWFRTGDGRLKTRAEIEGAPMIEREPNLFDTLSIVCRAEGFPSPDISCSTLTRTSIRESGLAACVASNEDGNATAEIEVRVLGPGSAPRDVRAIGWRNQINVSWQEPQISNGIISVGME
ncbi:unnamed protein product [Strongylus vulgaris]|uniref:Fibronectin type-III domain-containing protein n=1 Tax=Strongylus vulgaris TaxID=40348 RepID=A0A3P7LMG4_STRVU|nr:unnamed protein product [Strongylus vulgaris]